MSLGKMKIFSILFFAVLLCTSVVVFAAETHSSAGNASMQSDDDGEKCDGNIEINEGGVSIGAVRNNGGTQKNIRRCTKVENVTIINNGKTTVYRKKAKEAKAADGEKGQERRW